MSTPVEETTFVYKNSHEEKLCTKPLLITPPLFPLYPLRLLRDEVRLDLGQNVDPRNTSRRLHVVDVVSPPRASRPPDPTPPDIAVLRQIRQAVLERGDALRIVARRELADDALLLVVFEPFGSRLQTLLEDGRGHACLGGTAAVGVEVLVHLVDELVLWVLEVDHRCCVAARYPCPSTCPGVALGCDVLLCCAGSADAVDTGLVEVEDEGLVHVVEL
jgi:hypothetical protein